MSVARSGTLLSLLCTGLDRIHWGALVLCIWPDHIGFSLCTPGFISEGISTWLRRIWCLWILRCQVKIQLRCVVLFLFFSFFFWRGGATRVVFPRRYGNARVSGGIIGEWLSNLWNSLFFFTSCAARIRGFPLLSYFSLSHSFSSRGYRRISQSFPDTAFSHEWIIAPTISSFVRWENKSFLVKGRRSQKIT